MTQLEDAIVRGSASPLAGGRPGDALRCVGLTKTYGRDRALVTAVQGISCGFARGSFTAIMGPSGSGKSTLMHCLAGLDTPSSGQVFLGELEISALPDRALTQVRRDRIGFVFQSFNLLPTLTARQNILLPHELAGTRPDAGLFDEVVASLGLVDRLDHRPSELSGGQQQRVAVARALIRRPEVIFADEPTGALDSRTGQTLLSHLRKACREADQTIVMVTHDPVAAAYADRVLLISDGEVVGELDQPGIDDVVATIARLGA